MICDAFFFQILPKLHFILTPPTYSAFLLRLLASQVTKIAYRGKII